MRRDPRALVVDDDAVVRALVAEVLGGAGLCVVQAGEPSEAFGAFLEAGPFDVLVLDVSMPEMSGPALADALRDPSQEQRVLFVSGGPPPFLGAGRRFLAKPFSPDQLLREVRTLVEGR